MKSVFKKLLQLLKSLFSFERKNPIMDASAQQAKVDQLTSQVQSDQAAVETAQTTLANDQAALTQAQAELANISFINQLEALTSDQVAAINAALESDTANTSGIRLTLPTPAPAPDPNQASA